MGDVALWWIPVAQLMLTMTQSWGGLVDKVSECMNDIQCSLTVMTHLTSLQLFTMEMPRWSSLMMRNGKDVTSPEVKFMRMVGECALADNPKQLSASKPLVSARRCGTRRLPTRQRLPKPHQGSCGPCPAPPNVSPAEGEIVYPEINGIFITMVMFWCVMRRCCSRRTCPPSTSFNDNKSYEDSGYAARDLLPLPKVVDMDDDLIASTALHHVKGDGNCYWRALTGKRWRAMKKTVRRWHSLNHHCLSSHDNIQIEEAMGKNKWVTNAAIQLVTQLFSLDHAIYTKTPTGWTPTHRLQPVTAVHGVCQISLAFHDHHYSVLQGRCPTRILRQRIKALAHNLDKKEYVNAKEADFCDPPFEDLNKQSVSVDDIDNDEAQPYIFSSLAGNYPKVEKYDNELNYDADDLTEEPCLNGGSREAERMASYAYVAEDYSWDTLALIVNQLALPRQRRLGQRMLLLGGICARGHVLSAATHHYPNLLRYLGDFLQHHSPGAQWTAIAINRGGGARIHADDHNVGLSRLITFGNPRDLLRLHHAGQVLGFRTFRNIVTFNPRCLHSTFTDAGDRVALVFYTPRGRMAPLARVQLHELHVNLGGGATHEHTMSSSGSTELIPFDRPSTLPVGHSASMDFGLEAYGLRKPYEIFTSGWISLCEAHHWYGLQELTWQELEDVRGVQEARRANCPALLYFQNTLQARAAIFWWHQRKPLPNPQVPALDGGAMTPDEHKQYNKGLEVSFAVRNEVRLSALSKAQIRALLRADTRLVKKLSQPHVSTVNVKDWLAKAAATLGMALTEQKPGKAQSARVSNKQGGKGQQNPRQAAHQTMTGTSQSTTPPSSKGGRGKSKTADGPPPRHHSGKGGRDGNPSSSSTTSASLKKTETPPVFELEGEWVTKQQDGTVSNVPVVPKLTDSAPGICLLQDMETVTGLATTLRHSKFPAAVVTPFPVRDGALPTKHLPIFLKKTVGEVESKVQVMGYVTSLASTEVLPREQVKSISAVRAASIVMTAQIDATQLDAEVQKGLTGSRPADTRAAFVKLLPADLRADLVDIWHTKESDHIVHAKIRIKMSALNSFLKFSGSHKVWLDTPRDKQDAVCLTWLREYKEGEQVWFTTDKIRHACQTLPHLGLVRRRHGEDYQYGIRCSPQNHPEIKKYLGLNSVKAWIVEGAPIEMTAKELNEFLQTALQWQAPKAEETSCRIRKGRASWVVRCDAAPQISAAPLECAHEIFSISARPRERNSPTSTATPPAATVSTSWSNALSGRFQAEEEQETYAQKVRGANVSTSPRPAKKMRPTTPELPSSPLVMPPSSSETLHMEMQQLKAQVAQILQMLAPGGTGQKRPLDLAGGAEGEEQGRAAGDAMQH